MKGDGLLASLSAGGVIFVIARFTVGFSMPIEGLTRTDVLGLFGKFRQVDSDGDADILRGLSVTDMTGIGGGFGRIGHGIGDVRIAKALGWRPKIGKVARAASNGSHQLSALALADA